jgi:hypothetical protein
MSTSSNMSILEIENLKKNIESLSKLHQIEILKIIKKHQSVKINENKSGVYINLTFLEKEIIYDISQYMFYVKGQEQLLDPIEKEKDDFKNTFFVEKENKDEMTSMYSYI